MIKTFNHKGLRLYYETGSIRGIQSKHASRLRMQLAAMDSAMEVSDLDIPGYKLHPLKGDPQRHLGYICQRQLAANL